MVAGNSRPGARSTDSVNARAQPSSERARLAVAVAVPDGAISAARGLDAWLAGAAPARARGEVSIAIVSDGRMRSLNRAYRGKNYATDVLSFPAGRWQSPVGRRQTVDERKSRSAMAGTADSRLPTAETNSSLGDIVIAAGVAARQADEAGHSLRTELRLLALHGLLHLLGYDHESDAGAMARVEARLRRRAGLREGLIERVGSRQSARGSPKAAGRSRLPSAATRPPRSQR
jgi:probable rRNA maturation factor